MAMPFTSQRILLYAWKPFQPCVLCRVSVQLPLALEPLIITQSHCKIVHPRCTNYCWSHPLLFAMHGSEAVKSSLVPIVKPGTWPLIANFPIHLQNLWVWAGCIACEDCEIRTKSVRLPANLPYHHASSCKHVAICMHVDVCVIDFCSIFILYPLKLTRHSVFMAMIPPTASGMYCTVYAALLEGKLQVGAPILLLFACLLSLSN